ncbi:hypothetical protein TKK_0015422 [Trichogramma kaykai]
MYMDRIVNLYHHYILAIDELQGDEECYYGQLLPALVTIEQRSIQQYHIMSKQKMSMYRDLIQGLTGYPKKRFQDIFEIRGFGETAAIAALSHPSFKSVWVKCLSLEAQASIEKIVHGYRTSEESVQTPELMDNFFYFGESLQPIKLDSIISMKSGKNELLRFLAELVSENIQVLDRFPKVKWLFIKNNSILPSSAPVERLFSYATLLNLPKYNRLTDSQFENRVVYKVNLKKLFE